MGIYLNPGRQNYQMTCNSEIFVDKTEMISYLNSVLYTEQRFVSVSRPRRFGKTIAADMLCAYYDREADSRKLFEKLKIAEHDSWDEHLGKYDVLRIVMTDFVKADVPVKEALVVLQKRLIREITKKYKDIDFFDISDLSMTISNVYAETEIQFIIIIDEWDAVFRVAKEDAEGQKYYLDVLRDIMKDKPYVALAYMTGILPIKKYGKHSALNMFTEYSMMSAKYIAKYTGFTTDEVKAICAEKNMDFDAVKEWYDGYRISNMPSGESIKTDKTRDDVGIFEIYSPLSVVNAVFFRRLENYWNKTETYEALAEYIRKDYDGLKEAVAILMDGGRIAVDTSTYQNDMTTFACRDDVLSLLIHLGYLGYDDETSEVFIPNKEIMDEFKASTKGGEWISTFTSFEISQKLLRATWEENANKVAELLERAHNKTGNKTYNDEAALSYAVQYAYYAAQQYYTTILELDSGKGYADIVYLPAPKHSDKPALLIELKYDKTAEGAITQMKRQDYPDRLLHYKGNILLVGINYDKDVSNNKPEFKHHSCVIERA